MTDDAASSIPIFVHRSRGALALSLAILFQILSISTPAQTAPGTAQ